MNSEELKAYEAAVDNCEVLRERLAKYEDADGMALKGDSIIDSLRRSGLSIDGDNAYKRDLCDSIIGALAFGKQRSTPPPSGHWLERFYEIGSAEADERDAAPKPAAHSEDVRGALLWASQQLVLMTSADGSGHADAALAALMMAGIHECEAAQMVSKWKSRRQWAAPEESGQ